MQHEMRAEYEADGERVKTWHMVREGGGGEAMCGRPLRRDARALPAEAWGTTEEQMCHSCGALYLREIPSTPM
jgi:hypothetical protein